MKDNDKSKDALVAELAEMRQKVADLEKSLTKLKEKWQAGEQIATVSRAMIDAFDGLIYACSPDYEIEFMNQSLVQRTGRDAIGEKCYEALHGLKDVCPWCVNERVQNGETVRWEVQSPKDNRWYYVVNTPIHNRDGTISKMAMIQDVTERAQAEEALRESQEQLRLALNGADLGLWDYDLQTGEAFINERRAEMVGYLVDEIEPRISSWGSMIHPDDIEGVVKAFDSHARGETPFYECEHRLRCKSGEYIWVQARAKIVEHDAAGNPVRLIGTSLDITDRKRTEEALRNARDELERRVEARTTELKDLNVDLLREIAERKKTEEALRESEQRFRNIFEQGSLGIAVLGLDYRWIAVNGKLSEIVGYTEDELTKLTFVDITYPDDIEADIDQAEKLAQGEIPSYTMEKRYIKKNGDVIWINLTASIIRDKQGKPLYFLSMIEDITERRHTEEAVRESEERYRSLVENVGVGISLIDSDHNVVMANTTLGKWQHKPAAEFSGKKCFQVFRKRESVCPSCPGITAMTSGQTAEIEGEGKSYEGTRINVRIRAFPTFGMNGVITGFIEVVENITERKEAEEALRKSEEVVELALRGADLGLWDWYVQTGRGSANQRSAEILGYALDEIEQNSFFWERLLHPSDRQRVLEKISNYLEGSTGVYEDEYRAKHKSGDWKWILSRGKVTERDLDGKPLRMSGTFLDITDKKLAESQASEAHELRQKIVSESPMGIAVYQADGQCVSANDALARIVGTDKERLLAQNFRSLSSWKDSGLLADAEQVLAGGENKQREVRFTSTFGKGVWVNVRMARLMSENQPHLLIVLNDITERRMAEDALKFEREQLLSIFESINEVVLVIDPMTYEILYANKFTEALYGKALIGGICYEKLNGFDSPCGHCHNEETMKLRGQTCQWEYRNLTLKKDFLATDRMIRWPDGREVKFQIAIDITGRNEAQVEQERLEAQLFQAQKMEAVGTLAGGVAHDFNNILQVVLGYSDLILSDELFPERFKSDLERVSQAARNGADLVSRLLMFSRKSEIQPLSINLNRRIEQLQKMLSRTIPKMIEIELVLADNISPVHADPTQIDQILMNLAVNARDAMPKGGRLTIQTVGVMLDEQYAKTHMDVAPGHYVLLSVSDTGQGIDRDTVQHIFEPFFTTKAPGEGTGLGLSMVYGIVKQHGGHIMCYSEPGKGTEFKMYFPVLELDEETITTQTRTFPQGGAETILLVDDEELVRDLGSRILAKAGYAVITASNGKEALEIYHARSAEISLVILDLIMPQMGGKECLEELLKINPIAKVLIASGYSTSGPSKDAVEAGAKGFVNKPYTIRSMLQAVRDALDSD